MIDHKVIQVDRVSKKFSRSLRHMMWNAPLDIGRSILGLDRRTENLRNGEFWAIDDVSLSLDQGMRIGLIGRNGSGKSTLLKMLNGILLPDRGLIKIKGRVGALIELGAGFHPLLTGRENIFINGSIMGMKTSEIRKKLDEIIAFADIGDFLNSPVKFYSSGMYARLGFSVAVHANPDILLMDEVLAVGDIAFQKQCFDRLDSIVQQGTVIIFVSHSMAAVQRFCPVSMLLEQGKAVFIGDSREAAALYYQTMMARNEKEASDSAIKHHGGGSMYVFVDDFKIVNGEKSPLQRIRSGEPVCLSVRLRTKNGQRDHLPRIAIRFIDSQTEDLMANIQTPSCIRKEVDIIGTLGLECKIDRFNLSPGIYRIEIKIGGDGEDLYDIAQMPEPLEVHWSSEIVENMSYKGRVYLPGDWKVKKNEEMEVLS